MNRSRARALKLNMLAGWATELFTLISGLILPRLVLEAFGSAANGLVSSITQYLSFSVVLRAGLGGVTRAALYKPLANRDMDTVSSIMVATQSFMRKVTTILIGYIMVIALAYPSIANAEFDWGYMFLMVLILGANSVADNLLGIQAKILLQADQKHYILTSLGLLSQILSFVISVVLIKVGASLMIVKLATVLGAWGQRLLLNWYVRRKYKLNMKAKPNNLALKQRWDAFAQQMAVIVNDNVAITLMTVFVDLKEISVYTVHNMVTLNMRKLVDACVTGVDSSFGDMLAKGEREHFKKSFHFVEWGFSVICVVMFSVTAVMLTPFVRLYTSSITDVDYIRPAFAVAISLVSFMNSIRTPYISVVEAAGHFKQTKWHAFLEIGLNVVVSVVMLWKLGLIGVIIGAFIASLIRTLLCALYVYKNILHISRCHLLRTYGVYMLTFAFIVGMAILVGIPDCATWLSWCLSSAVCVLWAVAVVVAVTLVNNRPQLKQALDRLKRKVRRK